MQRRLCSAFLAFAFTFAFVSSMAAAQITNGDFENGGTGWRGGTTFPTTGGNPNGYARLESPATGLNGGDYSIDQNFNCGVAGGKTTCQMSVDYKLDFLGGTPGFGVVKMFVDRVLKYESPMMDHIPWTTVTFSVPCGAHNVILDLAITNNTSNHHWEAGFDNVTADCHMKTPTRRDTWGRLKLLYRR